MKSDGSRLVRAETIDLVGICVLADPASSLDVYFPYLLDAVDDAGLAVRRRAVGVLRELLLRGLLGGVTSVELGPSTVSGAADINSSGSSSRARSSS